MNKVDIETERAIFEGYFPSIKGLWIPDKGYGHGGYTGMNDAYWMGWICRARATEELHREPNALREPHAGNKDEDKTK